MDILDRLLGTLTREGTLTTQSDGGGWLITHFHDEPLEPPARLSVDAAGLQAWLDEAATGGPRNIWRDVDAQTEAYRLLLVHFDEEIERYDCKVASVEITRDGVTGTPRGDWSNVMTTDLPPGEGSWWAERPPYDDAAGD